MYQCAVYGKGQLMSQDASGKYTGTAATDRIYQALAEAARAVLMVECAGDANLLVTFDFTACTRWADFYFHRTPGGSVAAPPSGTSTDARTVTKIRWKPYRHSQLCRTPGNN